MGGMGPADVEVPDEIKQGYKCRWWFMSLLLIATAIGTFISAINVVGGLIILCIGIWAWYMVKDDCQNMSQYCMFTFGMMCAMQTIFELIPLLMSLGGRTTRSTEVHPLETSGGGVQGGHGTQTVTQSYSTTVKTTPFLDDSLGWHYNFQSYMMIITPIVMLLGALLAKATYENYPRSLFEDDLDYERQSLSNQQQRAGGYGGGGGGYGGGGGGGGGAPMAGGGRPVGGGGGGRPLGGGPQQPMFSGQGQTLGR